jgi:RNA polymerase subunit RPABC4/transcription elongation factor Spt4
MNWNNISLIVLGLAAFAGAFVVALWVSLVIWTFRDMRARTRDAFAQLLASLMVLVLGPFGIILYFILRPRETLADKYERSLEEEALLQDIEERHICPGCKQPIESDYVLCPICHTRLRQPCVHCGRLIHPRWNVCPYCAQSQRSVPGIDRAGQVTLLDLEKEKALFPAPSEQMDTPGGWLDTPRGDGETPLAEPEGSGLDDSPEEQLADIDAYEFPADTPDGEIDDSLDESPQNVVDPTKETQPLDIKAEDEGETRRPLSLFGQR